MIRALPLLLVALGCAPLPALITDGQIRAVLAPEQHEAGTRCAARLNSHVRAARASGIARPVVLSAGALLAGTGVALRDLVPDASLPLAATGAVLGLVASVVADLIANPATLLTLHANGLASWNAARVDPDDGEHLERCVRDEAPERSRMPEFGGSAP